jgi:hypothetical protein
MLDIFRGLKNLIKVSHIHIDSSVFRLHYSITVMILLAFSLIVTTRQYVGNPIDCIHTKDIPEDVLNTYCWIHSTYTLHSAHFKKPGIDVPHPGVAGSSKDETDKKYVKYYQWVCFCLFFQVRLVHTLYSACHSFVVVFWKKKGKKTFVCLGPANASEEEEPGPLRDGRVEKNMIDSRPLLSISRCRVVKKSCVSFDFFLSGGTRRRKGLI